MKSIVNSAPLLAFDDAQRRNLQLWLNGYMVEEDFPVKHIKAIGRIIAFFNESKETEQRIFEFVDSLE